MAQPASEDHFKQQSTVLKYTSAICHSANPQHIPWEHIEGRDIFVIVEGRGLSPGGGTLGMRVIRGTEILENIDVARLVHMSITMRQRSKSVGVEVRMDELPIFGKIREHLLAVRYRIDDEKHCRLQLKLQSSAECKSIADAFERRGMEFQVLPPRIPRPDTAASRPGTAFSNSRPLTAQLPRTPSHYQHNGVKSSSPRASAVEVACLAQKPSLDSADINHLYGSQAGASALAVPPPRVIDRSSSPTAADTGAAGSFMLPRPKTTPCQASEREDIQSGKVKEHPIHAFASSAFRIAKVRSGHRADDEHSSPRPPSARSVQSQYWTPRLADSPAVATSSSDPLISTSSATVGTSENADHPLATRTDSRQASDSASRPGSSLALPALPKPRMVSKGSDPHSYEKLPSTSMSLSAPLPPNDGAPPPKRRRGVEHDVEGEARIISRAPSDLAGSNNIARQELVAVRSGVGTSAGKALPMDELLAKRPRASLTERSNNSRLPRMSGSVDAPHEIESPRASSHSPMKKLPVEAQSAERPPEEVSAVERAYGAFRTSAQIQENESVDQYAVHSFADRQAALDQFMVDNLNNPSFTTLCEDVEKCWRRITLGL